MKFYTLDDCLMFTLRRVTFPGAPSPLSKHFRDKFSVSSNALLDLRVDEGFDEYTAEVEGNGGSGARPGLAGRSNSTSIIPTFSPDRPKDNRVRPPPLQGILKNGIK